MSRVAVVGGGLAGLTAALACADAGADVVLLESRPRLGGLTASFEKLVIDAEILQMMSEVLQPLVVDEASLGFDAIADVGPGGHFFGTAHTLERYETAFYRPLVSDWRNFETWESDGARTATQRANTIWKRLLAEAPPSTLDPAVIEAVDAFVARRKREIASG